MPLERVDGGGCECAALGAREFAGGPLAAHRSGASGGQCEHGSGGKGAGRAAGMLQRGETGIEAKSGDGRCPRGCVNRFRRGMEARGAARAVLVLAVLQLDGNDIGTEGTGGLAFVLGQCVSLAGLHLGGNGIRAERERGLERVMGQCTALKTLWLAATSIGNCGVSMLRASWPGDSSGLWFGQFCLDEAETSLKKEAGAGRERG